MAIIWGTGTLGLPGFLLTLEAFVRGHICAIRETQQTPKFTTNQNTSRRENSPSKLKLDILEGEQVGEGLVGPPPGWWESQCIKKAAPLYPFSSCLKGQRLLFNHAMD